LNRLLVTPHTALFGDGGAGRNGIGEGVSTAERTEEIEATSLTAAMAYQVKPTLARMFSMGWVRNLWQSKATVTVPKTENQLIIEASGMPGNLQYSPTQSQARLAIRSRARLTFPVAYKARDAIASPTCDWAT
jgi:hypothetical protein